MADYEGCSDGNCILREVPLRVHTNAGCKCLRDVPRDLRVAIQRRLNRLKNRCWELEATNAALIKTVGLLDNEVAELQLQLDTDYTPLE